MSTTDCYGCGRSGHWVKNCPNACRGRGKGRGRGKDSFCYRCGEPGHVARDCTRTEDGEDTHTHTHTHTACGKALALKEDEACFTGN
ncbi:hypothetical protein LDENG_00288130 [Lucifuga dentata]|nr:hypothetical protein LDENG_00288130 [Lucifuga dentata]